MLFRSALINVNKALQLSAENPGALVSRKYIKLGYAYQLVNEKKFDDAAIYYDEILTDFPLDKETLMNKANMYLITKEIQKGKDVYNLLKPDNPVIALNAFAIPKFPSNDLLSFFKICW